MDVQRAIDESRPMLLEFLEDIGLHQPGQQLDLRSILEPFSNWVDAQKTLEDHRAALAALLGAFICEYLIETRSAQRIIKNGRILILVPIQPGVLREFDPYAVAWGMVTNRNSLKEFLDVLCS